MEPGSTHYGFYALTTCVCWILVVYLLLGPVPGFGEDAGRWRCGNMLFAWPRGDDCDVHFTRQIAWISIALLVSQGTLFMWARRAAWADLNRRVPKP